MYNFTLYTNDLFLYLKHLRITKVSLQRDLGSKIQLSKRDLRVEAEHLMMLSIHSVSLLFSFVILHSNPSLQNLMSCLDRFAK